MPEIGEVKKARALGFRALGHSFIWLACVDCGRERWVQIKLGQPSSKRCRECAFACYGHPSRPHTEEEKRKLSEHWKQVGHPRGMLGKRHSEKAKSKMSEKRRGKDNPYWNGGLTELVRGIRRSPEYYQWRKRVMERDNHTCQDCGTTRGVEAHHIRGVIDYPSGIFKVENGLAICRDCHKRHTLWQNLLGKKKEQCEIHVNII